MKIIPPYLKKGDKVAIVAPAKKIAAERIDNAVKIFTGWGLEVITGKHVLGSHNYFSGTEQQRTTDMQEVLDDDSVKAVFCARGGYGVVKIIDNLNFDRFKATPKWVIGYSDISVLHSHIYKVLETETIHAPMPLDYPTENQDKYPGLYTLKKALFGEQLSYVVENHKYNKQGHCQAELSGGNISVIHSIQGSISETDTEGKILFIEDVGESMYHLDRMMTSLKRAGKLASLKGLIVGNLTNFKDNRDSFAFNKTPEQIISEAVADYNYPVCFGFPAGHEKNSVTLIMGREVLFNADSSATNILFVHGKEKTRKKDLFKNILISALSVIALFIVVYLIYYFTINHFL